LRAWCGVRAHRERPPMVDRALPMSLAPGDLDVTRPGALRSLP
jgi:hypothetical protein